MKFSKNILRAAKCSILSTLLLAFTMPIMPIHADAPTYTLEDGVIKLSNAYYEIDLNADNGEIISIIDQTTKQSISDGNPEGNLWSAVLDNGKSVGSGSFGGEFSQAWDAEKSVLTLTYTGMPTVTVTISVADSPSLKMQAGVSNNTGAVISDFELPARLKIAEADVSDALLPMMPGALISSKFFSDGRTFINEYPGVMFADYLALRSARGKLAVYTQHDEVLQPILLGFEHLKDESSSLLTHRFQTWIADTKTWSTPEVVINVGQDYPQTILNYRTDNGIDQYKPLTEKLGDSAQTYFASPMYKLDMVVLRKKFAELQDAVINQLNFPGMVHFVAYTLGGHDKNYPDFVPPDKKWGTTEDFAAIVKLIHDNGGLVVPYTNFSWWDNDGQTMAKLPADTPLNSIIDVKDSHGLPAFETFGPNNGFVMNLHNDFVLNKITEQHNALLHDVGVDGIFEDQWGARSAPYDFNTAGLDTYDPSTSYFEGVLGHYRNHSDSHLMTEEGIDVLAENGVGFMGTNYLWDKLGYRGATADVTSYYPMAGMLLRDKVLLYQHDLAAETWTDNKDMLRWNLAQGYGLSIAFLDKKTGGLNMDNPWLNLVGVFHKYALANYADQLVTSFDNSGDNVTQTTFSTYTVVANWDADKPYSGNSYTLPPAGVVTQANDGSVTAGVFTAYNNQSLSDGEHYLVEVRSGDDIKIFQPVGDDTALTVQKDPAWSAVTVTAYQYDGIPIGDVDASTDGDHIAWQYAASLDGKPVGYYQIQAAG